MALIFSAVSLAILCFGIIKTSFYSPKKETVKIAAVIMVPEDGQTVDISQVWADKQVSPFDQTISKMNEKIQTAVSNGAQIVTFHEYAMIINEEDEAQLRHGNHL